MKFKFPYENLMKYKKTSRDVAFRNFAEARAESDQAKETLGDYRNDITQSFAMNESISKGGVVQGDQIEYLKWAEVFLRGQEIKIMRQRELIIKKDEILEAKTEELSEAAKEFKIYEKLKEKMKERFKKIEKKHDQKITDEIVVMRAARNDGKLK